MSSTAKYVMKIGWNGSGTSYFVSVFDGSSNKWVFGSCEEIRNIPNWNGGEASWPTSLISLKASCCDAQITNQINGSVVSGAIHEVQEILE